MERKLTELELEVERLGQERQEERQAWAVVLAYLRDRVRSVSQDRAGVERACEELEKLVGV